ncbi:MAG TPA: hypothetical protein VLH39_01445, partial [Magnetospirillaceae bacterium]|nr:hypothetical protein [Magnetospirillaceae bacterium]
WGADGRAHPTELETADAGLVVGALLDAPLLWRWDVSARFKVFLGGGVAFLPRLTFRTPDSRSPEDIRRIGAWFYRGLRWVYPSAQVRLSYVLQERLVFEFATRGYLPWFNAFDPEAPSFLDHAKLGVSMGMRIELRELAEDGSRP